MPKQYFHFTDFSGGLNSFDDPRSIADNELSQAQSVIVDKRGVVRTLGAFVDHAEVPDITGSICPGAGLFVFDSDYKTDSGAADTGEHYLALVDVGAGEVDIYDLTGDSFATGAIDLGTIATRTYGAGNVDFPTDTTLTDAGNTFLTTGRIRAGDFIRIINPTDTGNNEIFHVIKAAAGTLTVYGDGPLTVRASEANDITIEVLPKTRFYAYGNAIRVGATPINNNVNLKQQWYGYIKRIHFNDASNAKFSPDNWFAKDNVLAAPTNLGIDGTTGDSGTYPTTGLGLDFGITKGAGVGSWTAEPDGTAQTWETALSFIYDETQESLLHIPASGNTFTTIEEDTVIITVKADPSTEYNERQTHARLYCRKQGGTDPWTLLADISLRDGGRASLVSDYVKWNNAGASPKAYTDSFTSLSLNLDTYEGLTGHFHDGTQLSLGVNQGDGYADAVVGGKIVYLLGPQYIDTVQVTSRDSGEVKHLRDRIINSPPGQPDKFPPGFFSDVVAADGEQWVAGVWWNSRMFAFKENTLHIIDFVTEQVETHSFRGIYWPAAVTLTPHGPVWANLHGVFVYSNGRVIDLINQKISRTEWENSFFTPTTTVGYAQKFDRLIITSTAGTQGKTAASVSPTRGYLYDFTVNAWTFADRLKIVGAEVNWTNFATDWNGDLIVAQAGRLGTGTIEIEYWDDTAADQPDILIRTKETDFGNPATIKVIDVVSVMYKASEAFTTPVGYSINGATSTTALSGDFVSTSTWKTFIAEPAPFDCYTMRVRIRTNSVADGTIEIKSITIRYREKKLDIS